MKLRPAFPIVPALIGPWDDLMKLLRGNGTNVRSMEIQLAVAKQQVVELNKRLASLEDVVGALTGDVETTGVTAYTVMDEVPLGSRDGSNSLFSLSAKPALLILSLNGVVLFPGGEDYTLTGKSFRVVGGKIPDVTDKLHAWGLVEA